MSERAEHLLAGRTPTALFLLLVLPFAGCAATTHLETGVMPLPNRQVAELSADDVARVMRRAGFTDDQIITLGTDLRNQLAASGAAQVHVGDKVEAMFAADGPCLHVSSRTRGSFIYDLTTHRIR